MIRALLVSSLLLMTCGGASATKRVALIIANSQYKHVTPLDDPRNDGIAIAKLLATIGFSNDDVILKLDLNHEAMRKAILEFSRAAENADVALIYYAGHGYGSGVNYLIPIDAEMRSARNLPTEAFSERVLEDAVKPARGLKLVILDACRNDPTEGRMLDVPRTRAISRGLQSVEPDDGVLVAYSAKHGTVAQDGPTEGNSPFAAALINHLAERDDIRFVFGAVRDEVLAATEREQEPFLYGSLGRAKVYLTDVQQTGAIAAPKLAPKVDQTPPRNVCGWYAIHYCSKSYEVAASEARKFAGWVVNTSVPSYPKFAPGWFCSVLGPMPKQDADNIAAKAKDRGFPMAYIKNPC